MIKTILSIILLITGAIYCQNLNEWSIPHNIGHTGFSPTTVLKPPLKIKWKTHVPGLFSGESGNGPVAAEGKVIIQGAFNTVVCFDAETGELLWRYSIVGKKLGFHFYPCIADGRVYVVFSVKGDPTTSGMYCLNLNTGDLIWKRHAGLMGSFRLKDSPQFSNGKVFLHSVRDINMSTLAEANYNYKAQIQAWDAATGDTLWTYTMTETLSDSRVHSSYNEAYNASMVVVGDSIFASLGGSDNANDNKTIALDLNGNLWWSSAEYSVRGYSGNMQYLGDKLLVLTKGLDALNPRSGAHLYSGSSSIDSYSKISAAMNGKMWNRGYGGTPNAFSIETGQSISLKCLVTPGDRYYTGCSAPRAANGYVYSGLGAPTDKRNNPSLYAWDETGTPVWWFRTTTNVCQDVAIANDNLFWVTNSSGLVYCFESDTRTVTSFKAICEPATLEQYTIGKSYQRLGPYHDETTSLAVVKAVITFSDGSIDTTTSSCTYLSLDTFMSIVSASGNVDARNIGTAKISVTRYGFTDTVEIPIIPSTATIDSLSLNIKTKTLGTGELLEVDAIGHFHKDSVLFSAVVDSFAIWSSSTTSIATVDKGLVTSKGVGGPINIIVNYMDKTDTLVVKVITPPSFIKRINFQINDTPHRDGWIADDGSLYTQDKGYGWLTPVDIKVKRDDRTHPANNYLIQTFIQTSTPTLYKIDAPDGDYVLRAGIGDISWGSGKYSWVAYNSDTICSKAINTLYDGMPRYCNIETKNITITGGEGAIITLSNFMDYLILASADQGTSILCDLADDDFNDPNCSVENDNIINNPTDILTTLSISPNPFNPKTQIFCTLSKKGHTIVKIFNIHGKHVATLSDKVLSAGMHLFNWNARNDSGQLASGIYIVKLSVGGKTLKKLITLVK